MADRIETERLILRQLLDSDAAPLCAINLDPVVLEFFPGLVPAEKTVQWMEKSRRHHAEHGFSKWAVERKDNGEFIGITGAVKIEFEAPFSAAPEMGWRLGARHWGQGFATEAAHAAIRDVFSRFEFPEIVAFTSPRNLRSLRVMEKLGMKPDGAFDHPKLPQGHPLQRHLLYRLTRGDFAA